MTVARYIITKCTFDDKPVTNLQLQKIMYCIQGLSLAYKSQPLIQEDFVAWNIGPIIPSVYYVYCGYGGNKIISMYSATPNSLNLQTTGSIVCKLRDVDPGFLTKRLCDKNGGWELTYQNGRGEYLIIPCSLIKNEFTQWCRKAPAFSHGYIRYFPF